MALALGLFFGNLWGPAAAFGDVGYFSSLGILPIYLLTNIALIVFMWRKHRSEFSWVWHGLFPGIAVVIMGYGLYASLHPLPAYPENFMPFFVLGWILVGVIWMLYLQGARPWQAAADRSDHFPGHSRACCGERSGRPCKRAASGRPRRSRAVTWVRRDPGDGVSGADCHLAARLGLEQLDEVPERPDDLVVGRADAADPHGPVLAGPDRVAPQPGGDLPDQHRVLGPLVLGVGEHERHQFLLAEPRQRPVEPAHRLVAG